MMPEDTRNPEPGVIAAAKAVQEAVRNAARGLVEREVLVELILLSAVAEEHLLVIGEPGTAKSEAVRRVAAALGGRYFEYLLGRFTEPSEIFGPIDLSKLQSGRVETLTSGMLPEAEIAFLDEVFLGSTAILNMLLAILNERRFQRGHSVQQVPLRLCVGASNALPEDGALAAFADRFLVRAFVAPVPDSELETLLQAGLSKRDAHTHRTSLRELDVLIRARRTVNIAPVQPLVAQAVRLLRRIGIGLTDRRIVRSQSLIAAAAAISGRAVATDRDLWPLVYAVPTAEGQESAREALRGLFATSESPLAAAVFDSSASPAARAVRIAETARELLAMRPEDAQVGAWKLQLEGVLREIDASFPRESIPEPLPGLREQIGALVAG
jgi:MoxR-like ATPase